VVLAGDGFAAGRQVESFKPDVLLLDLKMPGLNGFDVCQEIKTNPITRHIRIIAVTGYASAQNRRLILAAGAETCLAKPFQSDELLALLGVPTPAAVRSPTAALDIAEEIT
jgi:CheY-like chemotaxis protein